MDTFKKQPYDTEKYHPQVRKTNHRQVKENQSRPSENHGQGPDKAQELRNLIIICNCKISRTSRTSRTINIAMWPLNFSCSFSNRLSNDVMKPRLGQVAASKAAPNAAISQGAATGAATGEVRTLSIPREPPRAHPICVDHGVIPQTVCRTEGFLR